LRKARVDFFVDSYNGRCSVDDEGKILETPAYRYHEDMIWGATAGMMKNFVEIIDDKIGLLQEKK
jgi:hypothetical protein